MLLWRRRIVAGVMMTVISLAGWMNSPAMAAKGGGGNKKDDQPSGNTNAVLQKKLADLQKRLDELKAQMAEAQSKYGTAQAAYKSADEQFNKAKSDLDHATRENARKPPAEQGGAEYLKRLEEIRAQMTEADKARNAARKEMDAAQSVYKKLKPMVDKMTKDAETLQKNIQNTTAKSGKKK